MGRGQAYLLPAIKVSEPLAPGSSSVVQPTRYLRSRTSCHSVGGGDKWDGATMPILQLVCCVWVSNCLSPIQSLIVFFWQLWGYANQSAVCFIISLAILWLLAMYETGVLPWHWASYFWPFILFAFRGFTYAICPPRMPSLRAPCMCDHRGFCTKKGTELAVMLTLNALLFLFSGLSFWIKASEFLFYTGFHKLYSLSSLSLVRWWIFKAQLRNNN